MPSVTPEDSREQRIARAATYRTAAKLTGPGEIPGVELPIIDWCIDPMRPDCLLATVKQQEDLAAVAQLLDVDIETLAEVGMRTTHMVDGSYEGVRITVFRLEPKPEAQA